MRVFIGYDPRQPLAANVCRFSIERRMSKRIPVELLQLKHLPMKRRGLTEFSFSRYCVPHQCGFKGQAIFMDADMVVLDDIVKLFELADPEAAVSVVKNPLVKFEWSSLMVFNAELCQALTPGSIDAGEPHKFGWANKVGDLPPEWNHCVGYDAPRKDAKLIHYTQGIPAWPETADCEHADRWHYEAKMMNATVSWASLMGDSVHARPVMERFRAKQAA